MLPKKTVVRILLVAAIPLLIPAIGMQVSSEWDWNLGSFIFAWVLFASAGFAYKLATRTTTNLAYRIAAGLAVVSAFILTWINLAVGIIGSEDNPANLMYVGVIVVGMGGALLARFQPRGMARTLFTMALVLALVPVIALVVQKNDFSPGVAQVFALNACFVALFAGSALLFRRVARRLNGCGTQ